MTYCEDRARTLYTTQYTNYLGWYSSKVGYLEDDPGPCPIRSIQAPTAEICRREPGFFLF